MQRSLRIAYLAHALSSDWMNADAHFLRGLLRGLIGEGHKVVAWEPSDGWSVENLLLERQGERSIEQFRAVYPELNVHAYVGSLGTDATAGGQADELWEPQLRGLDAVILHAWNPPALAERLLRLRERCGYRLLFHDTRSRPEAPAELAETMRLADFDGLLAAADGLSRIYRELGLQRVWTLHEAADVTVFHPLTEIQREPRLVWIGNWSDSVGLRDLLLKPAAALRDMVSTTVYGARYPEEGLEAIAAAGAEYGFYLPNLDAPRVYAAAAATVHVPRQAGTATAQGIPTVRLYEALACGVPMVSAPWQDTDGLFGANDLRFAHSAAEMTAALRDLILDPAAAADQAAQGMLTVLTRHTCSHRAQLLAEIVEEFARP